MLIDLSTDKLEGIINLWHNSELISEEAVDNMRNIISTSNFKTIVDYVHVRANGDIIYVITGFVELKKSEGRSGTIL